MIQQNDRWEPLEGSVASILRCEPRPFNALREGRSPALILPDIYPAADCAGLVRRFCDQNLLHAPETSVSATPPRVDIGTSLGVYSKTPNRFFAHAEGTHSLFAALFDGFRNPVATVYRTLQQLLPDKCVVTAHEIDGRQYGPAIFRSYHNGQGHRPHYDSVAKRSRLLDYAVSRFDHQFAAVMCFQNSAEAEASGQAVLYDARFNEEVGGHLAAGTFHGYADEQGIRRVRVVLEPGDLYFFYSENVHEVPAVVGDTPRIVLAAFIAMSDNEEEVFVWS